MPQFYRFDKPVSPEYPKMVELFARTEFSLKDNTGITPIHVDDTVSSLSAILLDEDYYRLLLNGRTVESGIFLLRPEFLILFKAKAYLDLKRKKASGERIDAFNVRKHKNDILRITAELQLQTMHSIPKTVCRDFQEFLKDLEAETFDSNLLKAYGVNQKDVVERLNSIIRI